MIGSSNLMTRYWVGVQQKSTSWYVCLSLTQSSLYICAVWWESSNWHSMRSRPRVQCLYRLKTKGLITFEWTDLNLHSTPIPRCTECWIYALLLWYWPRRDTRTRLCWLDCTDVQSNLRLCYLQTQPNNAAFLTSRPILEETILSVHCNMEGNAKV